MVGIWFPGLTIPGTVKAGCLLNVSIFGVNLKIPPVDIVIFKESLVIWKGFKLFDTDDIVNPAKDAINAVPKAVWDLCKSTLDSWAEDFYKRRGGEKE